MIRSSRMARLALRKHSTVGYKFYDLVVETSSSPQPIEANMMTSSELKELKKQTKTTYEGNYSLDPELTPEQKIAKVFGGRIKGETRTSSSRISIGEPKMVAGVLVPDKPKEPDNCCMSGCINCVWELYNDDIKDWNTKRRQAAKSLVAKGGRWPENFHPPVLRLKPDNLPLSLANKKEGAMATTKPALKAEEEESWGNVPMAIRVFAEMEKKMKAKKQAMV